MPIGGARAGIDRFRSARRDGSDIALEIINFARGRDIDLIVVGRRGRRRFPGLLLGSASQKLQLTLRVFRI